VPTTENRATKAANPAALKAADRNMLSWSSGDFDLSSATANATKAAPPRHSPMSVGVTDQPFAPPSITP